MVVSVLRSGFAPPSDLLFNMQGGFFVVCLVIRLGVELVVAAPSIEACPSDSKLVDDSCLCDLATCSKPPCLSNLKMAFNGSSEPGSCCPRYSCEGCKDEALLEGKCPCALGATINSKGICECVDKQRHLVKDECVCNPQQCKLPEICDRKSVPTTVQDGCCKTTTCVACPQDSEPTNLETDELEDHCVCLPCTSDCGYGQKVVIIKKGTGLPGHCCDLYQCQPLVPVEEKNNGDTDCFVGDIIYENGSGWSTDDKQHCTCKNGLSLCEPKAEEPPLQKCWDEGVMYKHNDTWPKDRGCTICTCLNGEPKCYAHYCEVKESQIKGNTTASCLKDNKMFDHQQSWTDEFDGCSLCTCINGEAKCDSKSCDDNNKEPPKLGECQPLIKCNKQCSNGFRVSKKGCEICKCNPSKVSPELLTKYNITYSDLINILKDYSQRRMSTEDSSSSSITPTTSEMSPMPTVVLIRRNGKLDEGTTSPEPMITTTYLPKEDSFCWIIVSVIAIAILIIFSIVVMIYAYKNRRGYNVSESRGSYHSVLNTTDNNNTIKKSSIIRIDKE